MRVNLMVEGQESVTWPQWLDLARATRAAGLEGLFRSDHYQSVQGRTERSSLDAWATIAALAAAVDDIHLGTLVSPTTFRHPSVLAKSAVTADHVSGGGRIELGIGAGWHELEHRTHGFDFPDLGTRFDVFVEQLEVVSRQLREERFDFHGEHYLLEDCEARPKPLAGIHVIVGGSAGPRGARAAARWADEYNTTFPSPAVVAERRRAVDRACEEVGRDPLVFSVMTGCLVGRDEDEARDRGRALHERSRAEAPFEAWWASLQDEWVTGSLERAAERLDAYEQAGASRVMLQHQLHEDLEMVALLGALAA